MICTYDPLNHHLGRYSMSGIKRMCEVIHHWAISIEQDLYADMFELIDSHYQGGVYESKGGEILKSGIYKYPEDPDLYPLCQIINENEIYFFYEYDFLAIRDKETNETHMYRVD